MKHVFTRFAGIALVVAGIAGLVFSIAGIVVLARVEKSVEAAVLQQVELLDQTLVATADGLALAGDLLTQAADTATSLETTMTSVGQAVGDTVPLVDSVAELLGETLPATLESAQSTLRSIASSAKLVDDILAVVTVLPLVNLEKYDPEVPLNQGFEEVADSLDEIPKTLGTAQEDLVVASGNLGDLQQNFTAVADNIGQIATSLSSAESILAQYQDVVAELQLLVASVREGLPRWLRWLRWGLSLVLIWLGIAQIGLITQGWELVGRSRLANDKTLRSQSQEQEA